MKKIIDIDPVILGKLKELAVKDGRFVKNYIERVLIEHVKSKEK